MEWAIATDWAARVDKYVTTIPDAPVIVECDQCGAELHEGDEAVTYDGLVLCSDECLVRYLRDCAAVDYMVIGE
ncbi:MAG: hypothetical protein K6T78_15895 [Alicyclobacillus sp.]|nr:hypothetical protein [Alicyclobacillus sp.]